MSDIASALTASIANDGQTVPVADLPMGAYKHTNVANATARNNYAAAGQVQDSSLTWAGTAGGTADVITLTLTPAITAYAAGQSFTYKSGASANTTTMTVNVNGVGAKAIQKNGSALAAGDHPANSWFRITYDGAAFQLEQIFQPSAFMLTVMDDVDAATARATLGAAALTGLSTQDFATKNLAAAGAITPSSTKGIVGTTTNDNPDAGAIGEYASSEVLSASPVAITNDTPKTVTSMSLTAGDWDVDAFAGLIFPASTSFSAFESSISTTNNTLGSWSTTYRGSAYVPGAGNAVTYPIRTKRISIASTTTVYLVVSAIFTVSTLSAFGAISARRIR